MSSPHQNKEIDDCKPTARHKERNQHRLVTEIAAQQPSWWKTSHSCSNADACDFKTSWFARLEGCCQEIIKLLCDFSSNVWSQRSLSKNSQLLTCLGITVVSKMWAAHTSVTLHSMLISCQSSPVHLDSCWIAGFINNYYQPCILLYAFQCK